MKIYDYKEVYDSTLEYFNGDELATNVWITKYAKSELLDDGNTIYYEKTPDDMFHRIASEIARAGMKYSNPLSENEVYELIKDYKYPKYILIFSIAIPVMHFINSFLINKNQILTKKIKPIKL